MSAHTWVTEYVDGGHVGGGDFWRCTTCGCSGGPADMFFKSEDAPRWEPFIPGPAKNISRDCDEAQRDILAYVAEQIEHLGRLGPKGVSPRYARMFRHAVTEASTRIEPVTNLIPLVPLFYEIVGFHGRPSVEAIRARLRDLGFDPGASG